MCRSAVCYNSCMKIKMNGGAIKRIFFAIMVMFFCSLVQDTPALWAKMKKTVPHQNDPAYQKYLDFFEEVYKTMELNYYRPITRDAFNRFRKRFDSTIFPQLKKENKTSDYVKWRSAAYLVDYLKDPEDTFSAFFPPQPAKEYEQKVLGKKIDLGIEGSLIPEGYVVFKIEPRSDAYIKGLRAKDVIRQIDGITITTLTEEEINHRLNPLEGTKVKLSYLSYQTRAENTIEVISQEYFKQTVFMVPVDAADIFCLSLEKFNRKTSEDMFVFLRYIHEHKGKGLILDLRGNPGGPPLAAQEISSFFLTPAQEFAYFQKRDEPKASLTVPAIPEEYRYTGPIVILINEQSGSAAELFSGVMQYRDRAVLMGTNTAGKVLLKSMFNFDDESMLLLVTARGHLPSGDPFSFDGVVPDEKVEDPDADLRNYAARYLAEKIKN